MEAHKGQLCGIADSPALLCSASCSLSVLIGTRNWILVSVGSIFSAGAIPWASWWRWNAALVNARTKNTLWYNATLSVDKAEERICKQAGECILLLHKWRSKINRLSICLCMLACKSKPELCFKCFLKFLFRKERWETSEEQRESNTGLEVVTSHQGAHCVRRLGIQSSRVKVSDSEWTQGVIPSCETVWCVTWCWIS